MVVGIALPSARLSKCDQGACVVRPKDRLFCSSSELVTGDRTNTVNGREAIVSWIFTGVEHDVGAHAGSPAALTRAMITARSGRL